MNKKLVLLIIPLLLVSIVSALDLSDYPSMFIQGNKFNGILAIADNAPAEDVVGISDIAMSLQYSGNPNPTGTTIKKIEIGATKLASEVTDPNAQNLILIGMLKRDSSSGNTLIDMFYSGYPSGGLIKLIQNGNYYVLIVTGDTTQNVREAAKVLASYKEYNLDGMEFSVSNEGETPIEIMPYDIRDVLKEGETKTYTASGNDYEVTVIAITDTAPIYVKFDINGESVKSLKYGDYAILSDGSKIQVVEITPNSAGDVTQDLVEFVFKGKEQESKKCTDSDGGKNYYVKGETKGKYGGIYTDSCYNSKYVFEYICNYGETVGRVDQICDLGCKDGACIKRENNCTDSDGGKDYYVKGTAKLSNSPDSVGDYCSGNRLSDFYCNEMGGISEAFYVCPNGCKDGACIQETEKNHLAVVYDKASASDVITISDLVIRFKEYFGIGNTKLTSEVTRDMLDYRVTTFVYNGKAVIIVGRHSPAEHVLLSNKIKDYLLNEKGINAKVIVSSDVKYDDLRKLFEDVPSECKDSDGGKNYYLKGYVYSTVGPQAPESGWDDCLDNNYQSNTVSEINGKIIKPGTGTKLSETFCNEKNMYQNVIVDCPNGCKDGACIKEDENLYVHLDEAFSLKESQEAKVVDYKNMKVRLNSIIKECVTYTTQTTTTSSTDEATTSSGGGGGAGCKLIGAKVEVEMPSECKTDSPNEECATTGTGFLIKKGETKEVFGAELNLLRLTSNTGEFVVSKQIENDYVDVTVTPESQEIYYGGKAQYSITITDKHPDIGVACAACVEGKYCPPCVSPSFTYFIKIRNLPFDKRYEKQVTLNAGETKTTYLTVTPFIVTEEKVEAEEAVSTTSGGGSVAITGEVTASSAGGGGVAVSSSGGGGGGSVVMKKVAQAASQEETVSETAISETVDEAMVKVAPVEESVEEEVPISVTVPNLYRQYSFSVEVQQKNDPKVRDTAYAKLIIKPRIEPPEFPTEEITIKLYKGWNLISLPGKLIKFDEEGCTSKRKLLGFVYLKEKQQYVSLQEAQRILGDEFREYLAKNSFWIYSYEDCKLSVEVNLEVSYSGINLYKGWNLIPITEDMVGGYLGDILGDCEIEKIYKWEASGQEWKKINSDYVFSDSETSYGFIAKVSDYCSLGGVSILAPPAMPE